MKCYGFQEKQTYSFGFLGSTSKIAGMESALNEGLPFGASSIHLLGTLGLGASFTPETGTAFCDGDLGTFEGPRIRFGKNEANHCEWNKSRNHFNFDPKKMLTKKRISVKNLTDKFLTEKKGETFNFLVHFSFLNAMTQISRRRCSAIGASVMGWDGRGGFHTSMTFEEDFFLRVF